MATGKRPGHYAAQELKSKKSTQKEKAVAGSDLAQRPRHHKAPPKKR